MAKHFSFDVSKAIPAAWSLLWQINEKERASGDRSYRPDSVLYLTASDVENQVRRFAAETSEGKTWGSTGRAWGRDYSGVRLAGHLKSRVRDWLLDEVRRGRLESHNFGRHHVSGMRFRPRGAGLGEAEKKTIEKKEERRRNPKPRLCHLEKRGSCACAQKVSFWGTSRAWKTGDPAKVTCTRCLNILKSAAA